MTAKADGPRGADGRLVAHPRPCEICGRMFSPALRYVARGTGAVCSRSCRARKATASRESKREAQPQVITARGVRLYGRNKETKCAQCGCSFRVRLSTVKQGDGRFCSRACARMAQRMKPKKPPYLERHPDRVAAHRALRRAIRRGDVSPSSACEHCGIARKRIEGHHEDYSKPLDVIWLCSSCHKSVHRAKRAA